MTIAGRERQVGGTTAGDGDEVDAVRYRVLSPKAIWSAAAVVVLVSVGAAVWLLLAFGSGGDQQRNQLEAIKAAGTIVVLAGGAAALLLSARKQRTAEIALKQKDRDQALQMRVAAATEADADARRITDLYTKAVELVGSSNASVRLGGLYALERLAQDNEGQRQTIINVLCAYLRMPFTPPPSEPPETAMSDKLNEYRESVQEREVRLAAQRLLLKHLQPGDDLDNPESTFWKDVDLDLTGAVLTDFNLRKCRVRDAIFRTARFSGPFADFHATTFHGETTFDSASFLGWASLTAVNFYNDVSFWHCTFTNKSNLDDVNFAGDVVFGSAVFTETAYLGGSKFMKDVYLGATKFGSHAIFSTATFEGKVHISRKTEFSRGVPPEFSQYLSVDE